MSVQDQQIIQWREELSKQAQYHYRRRDIHGILQILQKLRDRRKQQPENLDLLDTATANVISLAAEAFLDDLLFEECFELCQEGISVLNEKAKRAVHECREPKHDSLAWCYLIYVLGDAKWKYAADCQDRVIAAEEMISRFLEINKRVCELVDPSQIGSKKARSRLHNLVLCGVMLIKVALRYQRPELDELTDETDQIIRGILHNPNDSYYWDMQIAKSYLSGGANRTDLNFFYLKRIDCMKTSHFSEDELLAYRKSAGNEKEYLLAHRCLDISCS